MNAYDITLTVPTNIEEARLGHLSVGLLDARGPRRERLYTRLHGVVLWVFGVGYVDFWCLVGGRLGLIGARAGAPRLWRPGGAWSWGPLGRLAGSWQWWTAGLGGERLPESWSPCLGG